MVATAQPHSDDTALDLSYGQARAAVRGRDTIVIVLLAVLVCAQLWFSWSALKDNTAQHTGILEEIQVQTYILSRPDSERPQLAMPKALYDRLARQPWQPVGKETR
jgi:hypothetical protein